MELYDYYHITLYDTRPYPEQLVHHLTLALSSFGLEQNNAASLDAVAIALHRYEPRLPKNTLSALAMQLEAAEM
jgi:hypothetical protein